jgi:uncharacterized OsmC-like protein
MGAEEIRAALGGAVSYLTEHPDEARYTDSAAVAVIEDGLRVRVTGPDGAMAVTDMPKSVGGGATAPSAGWLLRAAEAACVATLLAMRAAQLAIALDSVEVTVDSESDDRGILGIDPSVPVGPLSGTIAVRVDAPGVEAAEVERLVNWAVDHCPVVDAVRRAVPVMVELEDDMEH